MVTPTEEQIDTVDDPPTPPELPAATALGNTLFAPANVRVKVLPADSHDKKDDIQVDQYLIPSESSTESNKVRDIKSSASFWVVQQVGAYEHSPQRDNDPDEPDTAGPIWLGFSFAEGGDVGNIVYYETIRDVHTAAAAVPGSNVVGVDELKRRVSLHEALHRFFWLAHSSGLEWARRCERRHYGLRDGAHWRC